LIGTVVHTAIMASGGYDTTSSPLTIGLACGLVAGSVVLGLCWRERRRLLAIMICLGLLAGEGYALILTAERTLAYRENKQAPLKAAAEDRAKAALRLADAETALAAVRDTPRLTGALETKKKADADVVLKAAERGCAFNCRALLQQQVADAQKEVDAARAEVNAARLRAEHRIVEAREALAALPVPGSATPLADRLGIEGWKVDLTAAALASLAANGLGAFLIAFAAHGRRPEPLRVIKSANLEIAKVDIAQADPVPQSGNWLQTRSPDAEAERFARVMFRPNPSDRVVVTDIRAAYHDWCRREGVEPLPDRDIGRSLNNLFSSVGLTVDGSGSRAAIVGISWAAQVPAIIQAA
jgi:hypothetical protein